LTEPEIDEAFRRAPPDTSSAVPSSAAPPPPPPPPQAPATTPKLPPLRWTQVALRLGAAAAATAGIAHVAAPRYRAWSEAKAAEVRKQAEAEAAARQREIDAKAAAARAEAAAAASLAGTLAEQTSALRTAVDELRALAKKLDEKAGEAAAAGPGSYSSSLVSHALQSSPSIGADPAAISELLRAELRAFGATLPVVVQQGSRQEDEEEEKGATTAATTTTATKKNENDSSSVSSSTSQKVSDLREKLAEMQAKEAKEAAERARKGKAPLVAASPSPPAAAKTKAAAATAADSNGNDNAASSSSSSKQEGPAHPASYMDVLAMLERGETLPGIRDDIDDTPPARGAAKLPEALSALSKDSVPARKPKPWEKALLDASAPAFEPHQNAFDAAVDKMKQQKKENEKEEAPLASHPLRASAVASALSSPPPAPAGGGRGREESSAPSFSNSGFPYGNDGDAASNYFSGAASGRFGAFGGAGGGDNDNGGGDGDDNDNGGEQPSSSVNAGWNPPAPPPRTLPVNGGGGGGSGGSN